jgi:glutamyl-tRNA synthetase/glutamyl-Q tRNA(Asp) synthetase
VGAEIASELMLTRFAPAPTGYLHLGHVANAIRVWGEARARGGRVLLRMEDHDRERCRPEYETALLEDLDWLGFVPDLYPTAAFRTGRCESRQSDRQAIHRGAADRLRGLGLLYACKCSRNQLAASEKKRRRVSFSSEKTPDVFSGTEVPYPGTCRDLNLPFDGDVGWRVRLPPDEITFEDRWCGVQTQTPAAQCGDLLIRDRRGNWTYQFVVTVDDHLQGITDVIRGMDLLSSTGRQILLGRLIGRETPAVFAHHPLIMKSPTQKLSKSDGDTGVRDLRAAGWSAARVIATAAEHIVR